MRRVDLAVKGVGLALAVIAATAAFERTAASKTSDRPIRGDTFENTTDDTAGNTAGTAPANSPGIAFANPTESSAREPASVDCGLYGFDDKDGCTRVQAIVKHWKAPEFAALPVVGAPDPAPATSPKPDPRLDQANALAAETSRAVGPCLYNETEARVEVQSSALKLPDSALAECLARAFAQSRYRGVESRWLAKTGSHEAWIVRGDRLVKVEVDRKLESPAARALWTNFASKELVATIHADTGGDGRAVASDNSAEKRTTTENDVHELLGL